MSLSNALRIEAREALRRVVRTGTVLRYLSYLFDQTFLKTVQVRNPSSHRPAFPQTAPLAVPGPFLRSGSAKH